MVFLSCINEMELVVGVTGPKTNDRDRTSNIIKC